MTYLDPTWVDNSTGPFKDNTSAGIHPGTLRTFAAAVDTAVIAGVAAAEAAGALPGGSPLNIAHGGTGSTDAASARAALGLPGYTLLPRGAYNGATPYNPGDVVSSGGAIYMLTGTIQVTGTAPPASPWSLIGPSTGGGGGSPTGAAGGSLAGTYPSPSFAAGSVGTTELAAGGVTTAKIAVAGLSPGVITGTAVITTDGRLADQRTPLDASVTNAKIASGALTPGKFISLNTGVIGNGAPVSGVPTLLAPSDLANMLDQVITADQISVSTLGGVDGPSVQTGLQDLVDDMVLALDPRFE